MTQAQTAKRLLLIVAALGLLALPIVVWAMSIVVQPGPELLFRQLAWLFGSTGFVVLFYQFVLSSRVRLFEAQVGLDKLFAVHRITGVVGLTLIVLHLASVLANQLMRLGTLSFTWLSATGIIGLVIVATIALVALFYESMGWRYETWKRIHYAGYVVFPLVFVHSLFLSNMVLTSHILMRVTWWSLLGIYSAIVLYKIVLFFVVRSRPYRVVSVEPANQDITTITFDGRPLEHKPGQFMLLSLERNGTVQPSHPYTIASSPTWPRLQISAKAIGDFSTALRNLEPGTTAYLEGPYGVFSFLNYPASKLVFIVGGIGITPVISQLRYIRDTGIDHPVRLIWGNETEKDICFEDELRRIGEELSDFEMVHVMSEQEDWPGERGFITRDIVEKYAGSRNDAVFFVCGPPVMMDMVIPMLREMRVPRSRIKSERFAL